MKKIKVLMHIFSKKKLYIFLAIICLMISVVCAIASPYFEGSLINYFVSQDTNNNFIKQLLIIVGLAISAFIFEQISTVLLNDAVQQSICTFKEELFDKLNALKLSSFESENQLHYFEILTNDIEVVASSVQICIQFVLRSILAFVVIFVFTFYISPYIILIFVILIPTTLLLIRRYTDKSATLFEQRQKAYLKYDTVLLDYVSAYDEIKGLGGDTFFKEKMNQIEREFYYADWKSEAYSKRTMPVVDFSKNIFILLGLFIGAILVKQGLIAVGFLETIYRYTNELISPLSGLTNVMNYIQRTNVSLGRIQSFLELPNRNTNYTYNKQLQDVSIDISNVSFKYNEKNILNAVNLSIPYGNKVAFIGKTGIGKSTLAKIIGRLYVPNEGNIYFNHVNYEEIAQERMNVLISYVPQSPWFFEGTIIENINYVNQNITKQDVIDIAKKLDAHEMIMSLEDGYETRINQNQSNVPTYILQVIALIRAIVQDHEIVLLDEALSGMDINMENHILNRCLEIMKDKTLIYITHNHSIYEKFDQIISFDEQNIAIETI